MSILMESHSTSGIMTSGYRVSRQRHQQIGLLNIKLKPEGRNMGSALVLETKGLVACIEAADRDV